MASHTHTDTHTHLRTQVTALATEIHALEMKLKDLARKPDAKQATLLAEEVTNRVSRIRSLLQALKTDGLEEFERLCREEEELERGLREIRDNLKESAAVYHKKTATQTWQKAEKDAKIRKHAGKCSAADFALGKNSESRFLNQNDSRERGSLSVGKRKTARLITSMEDKKNQFVRFLNQNSREESNSQATQHFSTFRVRGSADLTAGELAGLEKEARSVFLTVGGSEDSQLVDDEGSVLVTVKDSEDSEFLEVGRSPLVIVKEREGEGDQESESDVGECSRAERHECKDGDCLESDECDAGDMESCSHSWTEHEGGKCVKVSRLFTLQHRRGSGEECKSESDSESGHVGESEGSTDDERVKWGADNIGKHFETQETREKRGKEPRGVKTVAKRTTSDAERPCATENVREKCKEKTGRWKTAKMSTNTIGNENYVCNEIAELAPKFLHQWDERDHALFLRAFLRVEGRWRRAEEYQKLLPYKTRREILDHIDQYMAFLEERQRWRERVRRWREERERKRREEIEEATTESQEKERERKIARKIREERLKKEREVRFQELKEWKERNAEKSGKTGEKEKEEEGGEREAREEETKSRIKTRKAKQYTKEERERIREEIRAYREDKERKEIEKQRIKQEEEERKTQNAKTQKHLREFQKNDRKHIEKIQQLKERQVKECKEIERRLARVRSQVKVTASRSRGRAQQATVSRMVYRATVQAKGQGCGSRNQTANLGINFVPHLRVPAWRKDL